MKTTKTRIAVAAALAVLSTSALADDAACSVCDDPTWPAIERPAPEIVVYAGGGEAEALLGADPTWPSLSLAAPSIPLVLDDSGGSQPEPVCLSVPEVGHALSLGAGPTHVAAR